MNIGRLSGLIGRWWRRRSRRGKLITAGVVAFFVLAAIGSTTRPPAPEAAVSVSPPASAVLSSPTPTATPSPTSISTTVVQPPASPIASPSSSVAAVATDDPHKLTEAHVIASLNDNKGLLPLTNFDDLKVKVATKRVEVEAHPSAVFDSHAFLLETGADALVASKAILGWYPSVQTIRLTLDGDFTDQFGHSSIEPGAWIEITKKTAAKFDYEGMARLDATTVFCDADAYYVHPAVWKDVGLNDRGCMTYSSK